MHAWRYAYDDANRVVGTSDARGCGVNYFYDTVGRELGEDYSPCRNSQVAYGPSLEVSYSYDHALPNEPAADYGGSLSVLEGRLVASYDRGRQVRYGYDGRGRISHLAERVTAPSNGPTTLYAPKWSYRTFTYSGLGAGDQLESATTGADVALLQNAGKSSVSFWRDPRGALTSISSSYDTVDGISAPLATFGAPLADGLATSATYGDLARTTTTVDSYDVRGRVTGVHTARNAPALWSGPTNGTYKTLPTAAAKLQLDLSTLTMSYQGGDVSTVRDAANPLAWPSGAKPVATTQYSNDAVHRLKTVTYDTGNDSQVPPFNKEYINAGGAGGGSAISVPPIGFGSRVKSQAFTYDWADNLSSSTADGSTHGLFDRALGGTSNFTTSPAPTNNQLTSATNGPGEALGAKYDEAGNLTDLWVDRSAETCANAGVPAANQRCSQRYIFDWDEVGNLLRARRWDYLTSPTADPAFPLAPTDSSVQIDDTFVYSGHDRVLKRQSIHGDTPTYDVNIFDSLVLRGTTYSTDYLRNESTESVYLAGVARVIYEPGLPTPKGDNRHVFFELQGSLGSVNTIIDRETSEVVEKRSSQVYGHDESEYRPDRWAAFREDLRFTGKMDDPDIGLVYFGHRYYSPALMRWISADPMTIHGLGASPNPYSYVGGNPAKFNDPLGLSDEDSEQPISTDGAITFPDDYISALPPPPAPTAPSNPPTDHARDQAFLVGAADSLIELVSGNAELVNQSRRFDEWGDPIPSGPSPVSTWLAPHYTGSQSIEPARARDYAEGHFFGSVLALTAPEALFGEGSVLARLVGDDVGALRLGASSRLRPAEIATGERLSTLLGRTLYESPHEGAEFVDAAGVSYDAMGTRKASAYSPRVREVVALPDRLIESGVSGIAPPASAHVSAALGCKNLPIAAANSLNARIPAGSSVHSRAASMDA